MRVVAAADVGLVLRLMHPIELSVALQAFESSKEKLFDFLAEFIPLIGAAALPYIVDIKNVCVTVFTKDKSARVKNASFAPLIQIFALCDSYTDETRSQLAVDLGVARLAEKSVSSPRVAGLLPHGHVSGTLVRLLARSARPAQQVRFCLLACSQ